METIYLSPSKAATYDNCPRQYLYKYVLKIKTQATSVNLVFGSAVHAGVETYLRSLVSGVPADPIKVFETYFANQARKVDIEYGRSWCKNPQLGTPQDQVISSGKRLLSQMPEAWERYRLFPVVDVNSELMIERDLTVNIGKGVILRTKLDFEVSNMKGETGILDTKTPANAMTVEEEGVGADAYMQNAEQLTDYQIAHDAHAPVLGLERVDFLGYWEFVKKPPAMTANAKGSYIADMKFTRRRTANEVSERLQKLHDMAEDIRRKRFPKKPGLPHNTPCTLCEFAKFCSQGSTDGLVFPQDAKVPHAA